jgi:hypothetical protein
MKYYIVVLFLLLSYSANASEEKLKLTLGGYLIAHHTTEVGSTGQYLVGSNINLQDDLGMDSQTNSFRAGGHYRFKPDHKFEFSYYALNTSSERVITNSYDIGDTTFSAGLDLQASLDMDIVKTTYAYSFYHNEELELAVSFGAHMLKTSTDFAASVDLNDKSQPLTKSSINFLAPLPVVGFRLGYEINDSFQAVGSIDYFGLNIDSFSGYFSDIQFAGEYALAENLGLGIGLNLTNLDMKIKTSSRKYIIEQGATGIMLYLSYVM